MKADVKMCKVCDELIIWFHTTPEEDHEGVEMLHAEFEQAITLGKVPTRRELLDTWNDLVGILEINTRAGCGF